MSEEAGLGIDFQFTPRDSPKYNGRVERKFQTLWACTRSLLNAAKLDKGRRNGVWTEAARQSTEIDNLMARASRKDQGTSHTAFYKTRPTKVPQMRQFVGRWELSHSQRRSKLSSKTRANP